MVNSKNIPQELRDLPQWVCWKWGQKADGKPTKVPIRAIDGGNASSTEPEDWTSFRNAYNAWRSNISGYAGVGFVFTEEAGYVGVDFDDCIEGMKEQAFANLKDGGPIIRATEEAYLEMLNSYAEISPSGQGFKVIFKGQLPDDFARRGFGSGNGVYQSGRFFTITGNILPGYGTITTPEPQVVRQFLGAVFPPSQRGNQEWEATDERLTDQEVIRIASHSKNGEKFEALWRGDYEDAGYASNSEADAALVEMLAFYTGPVPEQLDRLFRQSGLFRDKWDSQRGNVTYGEKTIEYVLGHMDTFYTMREDAMPTYASLTLGRDAFWVDTADLPLPPSRQQAKRAWRRMLDGFEPLQRHEMPEFLRRLVEHIEPMGRSFQAGGQEDWLITSTLGFFASLWAGKKFENLPLNLWTLSIGEQGTGKSVVADELDTIMHRVNHEYGDSVPLNRYSSGTSAGLMRRLDGRGQAVLAYFSEWSGFAKNMESEHSSNMREVLMDLYDGRNIYHQLAQEAVDIRDPHLCLNAVTTQASWSRTADATDAVNGLYSRFLMCFPDFRHVGFKFRDNRSRSILIEDMVSHMKRLGDFDMVCFKAGEEGPECYQRYRRETLKLDNEEEGVIDADNTMLLSDEESIPGGRPAARVKRVAALLELMETKPWVYGGVLYVRDENVAKAIRIVQRGVAYAIRAYNLLSRSRDEMDANRVRKALEQFGTLSPFGLLRATGLNKAEVDRAVGLLEDERLVGTRVEHEKRIYFLTKEA